METLIDKGKISSFESEVDANGNLTKARILPNSSPTMPTRPLVIAWHLRGPMGNLAINTEVWFALSNDLTGIILERADGEWGSVIPGDVSITKGLSVKNNVKASDMQTSGVASINSHVHSNGNQGADTGVPTG
mgnify:FL=1